MIPFEELKDHQKRAIVEYAQLVERILACKSFLRSYSLGDLSYTPSNSIEMSLIQYQAMLSYKAALEVRLYKVFEGDYLQYLFYYVQNSDNSYPFLGGIICNVCNYDDLYLLI